MHDLFEIEFLTFKLMFINNTLIEIHFNELKSPNFYLTEKTLE